MTSSFIELLFSSSIFATMIEDIYSYFIGNSGSDKRVTSRLVVMM